jgi:2-methylfumaryl-CoA isomerase
MYDLLGKLRVVEAASFIASPTAGLYLAQMGAEVIRVDQIGGGPDFKRWPLADNGASFAWEGLNKGKKSVALDLSRPEGRELLVALATAPGDDGGVFLTNFPVGGFLAHERLVERRTDLITVRIMGQADGRTAFDHTVNSAIGIPNLTGPVGHEGGPVNHVLPAWDLLTGAYSAFALLAAERHRRDTGQGQEVRIPLADVGIATIANLGQVAEVLHTGVNRQRYGNALYGSFGRDFVTGDGKRLMIMALTTRQWAGLIKTLGIGEAIARIEVAHGVDFATDEGARFDHRDALFALVDAAFATRQAGELCAAFDANGCCWGPYKTTVEAASDPAMVTQNPIFSSIAQPSEMTYPVAGSIATLPQSQRLTPVRAPYLGEHSDEILADVLGLGSGEIGRLHDAGVVASA